MVLLAHHVIVGESLNMSVLVYSSTKLGGWQDGLRFFLLKNYFPGLGDLGIGVTPSQTNLVKPTSCGTVLAVRAECQVERCVEASTRFG